MISAARSDIRSWPHAQGFTYWIRQPNRAPRPAAASSPPPTPTRSRSRRTTPTVSPMTSPSVSPHTSEDNEIDPTSLSRWDLRVTHGQEEARKELNDVSSGCSHQDPCPDQCILTLPSACGAAFLTKREVGRGHSQAKLSCSIEEKRHTRCYLQPRGEEVLVQRAWLSPRWGRSRHT